MIERMEQELDLISGQNVEEQGAVKLGREAKERKARDASFPRAENLQDRINQLKTVS